MTPKDTVTFVVGLTQCMTPNGHGVIRFRHNLLYDPKGHGDLCGRFDMVLWPQKVTGSLEVAMTYIMTPKVTVTFVVGLTKYMTSKGHVRH